MHTILNVHDMAVLTNRYVLAAQRRPSDIPPPRRTVDHDGARHDEVRYDFGLGEVRNSLWDFTLDTVTVGSSNHQTLDSKLDYGYTPFSVGTSVEGAASSAPADSLYAAVFDSDQDGGYTPHSMGTSRGVSVSSGKADTDAANVFDSDIDNAYDPNSRGTSRIVEYEIVSDISSVASSALEE
eukprot:1239844-Amphidinium_carterae.2